MEKFIGFACFGGSLAIQCVSMNNQPCAARPMLNDLNLDELHYCPFMSILDRCDGSCNTVEDPFGRICVPNKMKVVTLKVFQMITGVNKSKTLMKHISCDCECKFNGRRCMSKQKWTTGKCLFECKNPVL